MGCFSSKPEQTKPRCLNTDPAHLAPAPPPPPGTDDEAKLELRSQKASGSTWVDKPDELKHTLLHTKVGDRALDDIIAAVLDVAKRSFRIRTYS